MSEKRRKKWTPSPAGIAMLENVVSGLPTTAGLRGRSEHGGAAWTELALRRHGLLGANGVTVEGYLGTMSPCDARRSTSCSTWRNTTR